MIPALPEKETPATEKANVPAPNGALQAKVTDLYTQDVLDFVNDFLDDGEGEDEIVDALRKHEFSCEESMRLVRAMVGEREREATSADKATAAAGGTPQPRLTDLYTQDVLDFVSGFLDRGASENEIVDALRQHAFSDDEARRIVRTMAGERAAKRSNGRSRSGARRSRRGEAAVIQQASAAETDAGQREMMFGAMWFLGGLLLTVFTFAAGARVGGILFWGALVWGPIQFFRGANRVAEAKNLGRQNGVDA